MKIKHGKTILKDFRTDFLLHHMIHKENPTLHDEAGEKMQAVWLMPY